MVSLTLALTTRAEFKAAATFFSTLADEADDTPKTTVTAVEMPAPPAPAVAAEPEPAKPAARTSRKAPTKPVTEAPLPDPLAPPNEVYAQRPEVSIDELLNNPSPRLEDRSEDELREDVTRCLRAVRDRLGDEPVSKLIATVGNKRFTALSKAELISLITQAEEALEE